MFLWYHLRIRAHTLNPTELRKLQVWAQIEGPYFESENVRLLMFYTIPYQTIHEHTINDPTIIRYIVL